MTIGFGAADSTAFEVDGAFFADTGRPHRGFGRQYRAYFGPAGLTYEPASDDNNNAVMQLGPVASTGS